MSRSHHAHDSEASAEEAQPELTPPPETPPVSRETPRAEAAIGPPHRTLPGGVISLRNGVPPE